MRTPDLFTTATVADNAMLLAYEDVDGQPLDRVAPEKLTDEVCRQAWQALAALRHGGLAHRDLRLANLRFDGEGGLWVAGLTTGELAATAAQRSSDVAELLVSMAVVVGPQRAIRTAVGTAGPGTIAAALPRLQPLALTRQTRAGVRRQPGLLDELRNEVLAATGAEDVPLEELQRVRPGTALSIVGGVLAVYFLISQIAGAGDLVGQLRTANGWLIPAVLVASALTYVGAALTVMGSIAAPLPLWRTVLAQLAGSFANRVTPVKVGSLALNVRYLQRSGIDPAIAVAGIGLSQLLGFVTYVPVLLITSTVAGQQGELGLSMPSRSMILLVGAGLLALAGLAVGVPRAPAGPASAGGSGTGPWGQWIG